MTSAKKNLKIAIVVQRYGLEVSGGAELHARWLAEHLLTMDNVSAISVLTSCAIDYRTWENHYPAGITEINGVTVYRFPVDMPRPRERTAEELALGRKMFKGRFDPQEEALWMWRQGPSSSHLLHKIEQSYHEYDAFIFFTYQYVPTVFGLPRVSDKSILVPTAHEEQLLYQPIFRTLFHAPRAIAYNTEAERLFVNRITRNDHVPHTVVGIGINEPPAYDPERFRQKFNVNEPFITFIGRLAEQKNVPQLVDYFVRYKESRGGELKLVLMGKGHVPIPERPDIIATGFVTEQDKFDGLAAAEALIVPSVFESLSMIALEGWLMERPVIVNGNCEVLKVQCQRSQGGLYYTTYEEFAAMLTYLQENPDKKYQLGQNGRRFVDENYSWDTILAKYRAMLELVMTPKVGVNLYP